MLTSLVFAWKHAFSCTCLTAIACVQLVFGVCAAGAVILNVNANLLGGNIGFFQSLCLLGYCLFPLDVSAIVTTFVSNIIARWIVVVAAVIWSSWASVPFIGGSVPPARRALAVFPLLLLYTTMGWLALVRGWLYLVWVKRSFRTSELAAAPNQFWMNNESMMRTSDSVCCFVL